MANYLSKEKIAELVAQYGGKEGNTGSVEAQIALFTARILGLSEHLTRNKKDFSCRRTLLTLVGKRKSMLNYLHDRDITKYRQLIKDLNIRK
ncbi:MAG: 30S ribosomal protein S15 [Saprospiraceae bacterium]|jgi:small subunit ribosomal protein S15|nr:30S ribosomal protein S15 [Saprospiraceae bacterium]